MLISREMVEQMRPGSVIVDVAASSGGQLRTDATRAGRSSIGSVLVMGPTDLAGRVAVDASQMYARNLAAFIDGITDDDANLAVDFDDEIVSEACITHDGHVTHPVTRRALNLDPER